MGSWRGYIRRIVLFPIIIIIVQSLCVLKRVIEMVRSVVLVRPAAGERIPITVRTPEERFKGLDSLGYGFQPHYVELPIGGGKVLPRVHYIDEGPRDATETILCLHGEPSWSFLYRRMIPGLVGAGYRVVVPDFIGFGKSDKLTCPDSYTHDLHCTTLRHLLDHLKIRDITLVCQDWGGLTGLSVVKDCSQVFARLVIMNTGLPVGARPSSLSKITPFLMWQSFVELLGTSLPIGRVFKMALVNPDPDVIKGYEAPFPSSIYKAGAARWPLLVPLTPNTPVARDMQETRDFLSREWKGPVLVMFSDGDPITRGQDKVFLKLMPHARAKTVVGARHFLQEDKGEEVAAHVISFIGNKL